MTTAEKLRQLIPHWREHNEAHAQSFLEWADKARAEGLAEVADAIGDAVRAVERANEALAKAHQTLGGAPP